MLNPEKQPQTKSTQMYVDMGFLPVDNCLLQAAIEVVTIPYVVG